ncbi:hypothetical protein L7F22_028115 [Adiantum nelumboides]|nr:hypothetical protein [Adiantum nelumboides]
MCLNLASNQRQPTAGMLQASTQTLHAPGQPTHALGKPFHGALGNPLQDAPGKSLHASGKPLHAPGNPLDPAIQPFIAGTVIMFGSIQACIAINAHTPYTPRAASVLSCLIPMTHISAAAPTSSMLRSTELMAQSMPACACPVPIIDADEAVISTFLGHILPADDNPHATADHLAAVDEPAAVHAAINAAHSGTHAAGAQKPTAYRCSCVI